MGCDREHTEMDGRWARKGIDLATTGAAFERESDSTALGAWSIGTGLGGQIGRAFGRSIATSTSASIYEPRY